MCVAAQNSAIPSNTRAERVKCIELGEAPKLDAHSGSGAIHWMWWSTGFRVIPYVYLVTTTCVASRACAGLRVEFDSFFSFPDLLRFV